MPVQWTDITSDDRWLGLEEEDKETIRQDYFDSVVAPSVPSFALDDMRQEFDERTSRTGKGLVNDLGERAYTGFLEMGLAGREIVGKISTKALDVLNKVDEWIYDVEEGGTEEFVNKHIEESYQDMSPRMRESMQKDWWDEEEEKLGLAAYDPYAYIGIIAQSTPETVATMLPAFKVGKMIYGMQRAKKVSEAVAAARAATGAQIAGSVLEGTMAGGHASLSVKDELSKLPDDVWEKSDVFQELIASGMTEDEAKTNIMESSSTQALLMATGVTMAFGGWGDRMLTQGILRGLKGGIAKRIGVGAVAESIEEGPQEGGAQIAENIAIQNVDPTRSTGEGVINATIGGVAGGAPMGAAFGAVTKQAPIAAQPGPTTPPPAAQADPIPKINQAETIDEAVESVAESVAVSDQMNEMFLAQEERRKEVPGEMRMLVDRLGINQERIARMRGQVETGRLRTEEVQQREADRKTREFLEQEYARQLETQPVYTEPATEPTAMQLALQRAGAVQSTAEAPSAKTIREDQTAATQERPQPKGREDLGQPDREFVAAEGRQATDAAAQKEVGQAQRVAGTESVVADTQRVEGVDYELYRPAVEDGQWTTRIFDVDSGETVGITQHPTQAAAVEAHNQNTGQAVPQAQPALTDIPGIEPEPVKEDPRVASSRRMKERLSRERTVNPEKDDLLAAIAKAGGISRADAEANGIDPADFGRRGWRISRVFTKNGDSLDGMAQRLSQDDYPVTDADGNYTPNELLNALTHSLVGDNVYSKRAGDKAMAEMAGAPDYGDMEPAADEMAEVMDEYDFTENQRGIANVLFEAEALLGEAEAQRISEAHDNEDAAIAALEEALENHEKQRLSGGESRREPSEEASAKQEELLQSYTEEDIRDREQAEDTRRQAEQTEDAKARADEQGAGFVLTGSSREVDEREARGQQSLLSYLGPKAATADLSALKRAAEMEQAGVPADQIREDTGWFLGMDDKWRFEVSDDVMTLRKNAKTQPGKPGHPPHWLLGDLVDHPQLFEAYPQLFEVKVETTPGLGVGNYNPDTNTIGVSQARRREVLAHEIQHIIQRIEEFARGGSIGAMARPEHEAEVSKEYQRGEAKRQSDLMNQAIMDGDADAAAEHRDLAAKHAPFQAYQRLAGEIEARDTQSRINMTAKDRSMLDPYTTEGIPKEEAILQYKDDGIEEAPQLLINVPKIIAELERDFGKANIKRMMAAEFLEIEETTPRYIPQGAGGTWDGHVLTLYADTLVSAGDGFASAVLTHEGEHAGMRLLLGNSYGTMQKRMDSLIKAGDPTAMAALERVPVETAEEFVQAERLAYFIEESYHRIQNKQAISGRARNFLRQLLNKIKAWFRQTDVGKALANAGIEWKLTDAYAVALAHRALQRATDAKIAGEPLPVPGETMFSTQAEFGQSVDENVQARLEAAAAPRTKRLIDAVKEGVGKALTTLSEEFTRAFQKLDKKKYAQILDLLRQWKSIPEYAHKVAADKIYDIVREMDETERFVFTMNLVLPDMKRDIESGLLDETTGYPFGYTNQETIDADIENFQRQAESNEKIRDALAKRKDEMASLRGQLVDAGFLKEELRYNEEYYHHQVLDYLAMKEGYPETASGDVRTHRKGWQIARKGKALDYNLEYMEAEFAVVSQGISQLRTKELLERIGADKDIKDTLKAEAKAWNRDWMSRAFPGQDPDSFTQKEMKEAMGDDFKTYQDLIDKGTHVEWTPTPGKAFYQVNTIKDAVLQDVLSGASNLTEDDIKKEWLRGKDQAWVLPVELAETLDDPQQFPREDTLVGKTSAGAISAWKQWTLFNPFRVIRYNLNNMSGDMDIALAYDWRIFKYFNQAYRDLYQYMQHPERMSAELKKELDSALKLGTINSGFVIHEIQDFKAAFDALKNPTPNLVAKYWRGAQKYTNFRENWMRLSAFRYFKDRLSRGDQGVYGASMKDQIDAIGNQEERAAKLSRELIGDYGDISHAGQYMRRHILPFYSWLEINAPRYIRLMKNLKHEQGRAAGGTVGVTAWKATKLGAKMAAFAAAIMMFNRAAFPDEEEELSDAQRRQLHLILGRREDGSIRTLRLQGAFSDFLSWVGAEDIPSDVKDLMSGKTKWNEYLLETSGAAPSKLWHGAKPIEKTIAETVIGWTTWPKILQPRPIRDRWEHVSRSVSMGLPYRHTMGLPTRGFGNDVQSMLIYNTDPGESAYHEIRAQMYDFLDENDVVRPSISPTSKSNTLYYYKQAMKFGDWTAAKKYRDRYFELGGTRSGMKISVTMAEPIRTLPTKWRKKFINQLSTKEKDIYRRANAWYRNTYLKRHTMN